MKSIANDLWHKYYSNHTGYPFDEHESIWMGYANSFPLIEILGHLMYFLGEYEIRPLILNNENGFYWTVFDKARNVPLFQSTQDNLFYLSMPFGERNYFLTHTEAWIAATTKAFKLLETQLTK